MGQDPHEESVADCFRKFGLLADHRDLFAQPAFEIVDDRKALLLANCSPHLGAAAAADVLLDCIEPPDVFEHIAGNGAGPAAASW